MSGTRLTRLKKVITDNQKDIAAVAAQTTASYATQLVAIEAVKHSAPEAWKVMNTCAQDYFVSATGFAGSVIVNGGYKALHNIATGAEWTWKQVGLDVLSRTMSSFLVQAGYNGINMAAGRDINEISPLERAGVDSTANIVGREVINASARFLNEKAAKYGFFNKKPAVENAPLYDNLLKPNGIQVNAASDEKSEAAAQNDVTVTVVPSPRMGK